MMKRSTFQRDGFSLSFLDSGGPGEPIIALHALWMEAGSYAPVAARLAPDWRVIALDQRGHGESGHPDHFAIQDYLADIRGLIEHLGFSRPVVLMGNSMGATNAFRFAAHHPELVRALINEEGPAEEQSHLDFVKDWAGVHPTREALLTRAGERLAWSIAPSVRHTPEGWRLAPSPDEILTIAQLYNGDWWADWMATDCPALVIRGADSKAVEASVMNDMAARRPNTQLAVLEAGHVAHEENAKAFIDAVRPFLKKL